MQMKKNPKIEICGVLGEKWIRVTAEAVFDNNYAASVHLLEAYPELATMYRADDGITEVFYLKNAVATIYTYGGEPKQITF